MLGGLGDHKAQLRNFTDDLQLIDRITKIREEGGREFFKSTIGKGSQISLSKTPKNIDETRGKSASGLKEKSNSVIGFKENAVKSVQRPFMVPPPPISVTDSRFKTLHRPINTPAPGHYNPRYQSIYKVSN
jgi:hypothetical protein